MRKILLLLIIAITSLQPLHSQSPQQINYQAVVRNANGQPIANGNVVSLRFTIHDIAANGNPVFIETQTAIANQFGLVNVQIGTSNNLAVINWSNGAKYLQVELDPTGGNNFLDMGVSQLLSVPYALFAANSAPGPTGATGATGSALNAWDITGNSGTVVDTNFIGTTDAEPFEIKVDNVKSGYIDYNSNIANTGFGFGTLNSNTGGYANTAFGYHSLYSNAGGGYNTAVGCGALYNNLTGGNTAIGNACLHSNTTGYANTASGLNAMLNNTTGNNNAAFGLASLAGNIIGDYNTAIGSSAMSAMGGYGGADSFNVAIGYYALGQELAGAYNTVVGAYAMSNLTNEPDYITVIGAKAQCSANNSIAIGYAANVVASNEIVIGNSLNTILRCNTQTISSLSDIRFKKNVAPETHGLDFIMQLKPITYNLDVKKLNKFNGSDTIFKGAFWDKSVQAKEAILYSGFSAQQVDSAAQSVGYNFAGVVKPQNDHDTYSLSYSDFVVPLVKAMQEQEKTIEELKAQVALLMKK